MPKDPLQLRTYFNLKGKPVVWVQNKSHLSDHSIPELWHARKLSFNDIKREGGFVRAAVKSYHADYPDPNVRLLEPEWKLTPSPTSSKN